MRRESFVGLRPYVGDGVLGVGGKITYPKAVGTYKIPTFVNGRHSFALLKDALWNPEAGVNLISVSQLAAQGMKVEFCADVAAAWSGKELRMTATQRGGLYFLDQGRDSTLQSAACAAYSISDPALQIWHRRLAHLSEQGIKQLMDMSTGIKPVQRTCLCKGCALGRLKQVPHKGKVRKGTRPLEYIHADISGPFPIEGYSRERYWAVFIDDFTQYAWVFPIKHRADFLSCFKSVLDTAERPERRCYNLHIDKAGENISTEVQAFCKDHGIALTATATEQHEQNGIAERLNGVILERLTEVLANMDGEEVPSTYWPILLQSVMYLRNRSPSSVIGKTPYEAWFGQSPDLAHLRTLGAKGFVGLKRSGHRKLDPVSEPCRMLGYQGSTNYIVLTDSGVTVSNNVLFDEYRTCLHRTLHAGGEAKEVPAEIVPADSGSSETTLDTIVVADPEQRKSRRIRCPFPLHPNTMLAYSFLGAALYTQNPTEPPSYRHAKADPDWPKWLEAMRSEHESLQDNNTWSLVARPTDKRILSGKWVYKLKRGASGELLRYKARWVVRGFEQTEGIDYNETFASVVKPMSYKAIFAIAAALDLELEQMDVKTAFLYGDIDGDVYMEQPPEFDDGTRMVCKLNKALYGLKQAPRIWYQTLAAYLEGLGFYPLTSDVGIFVKGHTYIAVYVDDLLIAGPSKEEIQELKNALSGRFQMTDLGPCSHYLGMAVTRDRKNRTIRFSQKAYIEKILKEFGMTEAKPQYTPIKTDQIRTVEDYEPTEEIKTWYAKAIGSLMYAMLGTRPDIAFAVSYCSRFLAKPTEAHRGAVKRIMRYLKATIDLCLVYEGEIEPLTGFTDSDWAGDRETRRSTSGYVFNLGSGAISWSSKRQSSTALSSCEAEYIGQTQATKEAIWLRRLLKELQIAEEEGQAPAATIIYGDNQGAIALAKNPQFHARTKHIDVQHHFVREKQHSGEVDLQYVPTDQQVADGLTKALPQDKFEVFRSTLGLA
jgi:transposase InsO family protein